MTSHVKPLRIFRCVVPTLVAAFALAPAAIVWDSSPAASSPTSDSLTNVFTVTLRGSTTPTLRAVVTGEPSGAASPTGTVSFFINGSGPVQCDDLATNTIAMSGGVATCKITSALVGSGSPETAQAMYSGDGSFSASDGSVTSSDGSFTPGSSTDPGTGTPQPQPEPAPPSGDTAGFGQPIMATPPGYSSSNLLMDDTFSSLDPNTWSDIMGGPCPSVGAWGGYGTEPVIASGGGVTLTNDNGVSVLNTCNPKTGQNLFTFPSAGFYLQVNFEVTDTSNGFWPAIWFPAAPGAPSTHDHEIDLYEGGFLSSHPINDTLEGNYGGATNATYGDPDGFDQWFADAPDTTQNFTTLGMEFVPGQHVNFYVGQGANRQLVLSDTNTANIGSFSDYNLVMTPQGAPCSGSGNNGWHTCGNGRGSMKIAEVQVYSLAS